MASSKKKQDEKNLKLLRELGSQPQNRACFDCHQKGPTYINMTIGSFVCTSCSGILRGLNPPHRVKSISMASFTPEEIEMIKSTGNQYCTAVWLGLYDEKSNLFPDYKYEHKVREFMISKYEKKRFYIDPSVATKFANNSKSGNSSNASTPGSDTKVLGTVSNSLPNTSVSRPVVSVQNSLGSPSSNSPPGLKPSSSVDLLAGLTTTKTDDPFSPQKPATATRGDSGFANFENATIFSNTSGGFITNSNPTPLTHPSFSSHPLTPLSSNSTTLSSTTGPTTSTVSSTSLEDRYAALKDLDEAIKIQKETDKLPTSTSVPYGTTPSNPISSNDGQSCQKGASSVFGTSPVSTNLFFNQPSHQQGWNAAFSSNPFSGTSNSTNTPSNSWVNGSPAFGSSSGQSQQNPFAGGADPNFNSQFLGSVPVNGTNNLTSNANWASFGTQQNNTQAFKMANTNPWASADPSVANPFSGSQIPTSGSSFNPFL